MRVCLALYKGYYSYEKNTYFHLNENLEKNLYKIVRNVDNVEESIENSDTRLLLFLPWIIIFSSYSTGFQGFQYIPYYFKEKN